VGAGLHVRRWTWPNSTRYHARPVVVPERGVWGADGDYREIFATFHSNTYVIRYQVEDDTVIIGRIFHSLEDR
jgi:plasmid stabilization system protein ParE